MNLIGMWNLSTSKLFFSLANSGNGQLLFRSKHYLLYLMKLWKTLSKPSLIPKNFSFISFNNIGTQSLGTC